ncbi:MAG TPA: trypsin-like peptidase domain-containing protein [Tepidisphaeraceae bacterium]|nr:trypsin-like peptidase domain-containing protein [Tepidisphaeraceae bacterium]
MLLGVTSALPAAAAIVAGGDGTQNTTAVGTVSQFNNVGRLNGASGIYLGDGVVLTAYHVGPGTITFASGSFTAVSGSELRLQDPIDSTPTDLVLFRIGAAPALPSLTIASTTPLVGTSAVLAGNGRNRAESLTYYDVSGTHPDFTWTETSNPATAEASGYKWAADNTLRWGSNVTENASRVGAAPGPTVNVNARFGNVRSILTDFDNVLNEGQAAGGDSGGAMFDTAGTLIGLMHAIGPFEDQPANTSIFGNVTYAADLSYYRSQIVAYVPEPSSALFIAGMCAVIALRRRRAR